MNARSVHIQTEAMNHKVNASVYTYKHDDLIFNLVFICIYCKLYGP